MGTGREYFPLLQERRLPPSPFYREVFGLSKRFNGHRSPTVRLFAVVDDGSGPVAESADWAVEGVKPQLSHILPPESFDEAGDIQLILSFRRVECYCNAALVLMTEPDHLSRTEGVDRKGDDLALNGGFTADKVKYLARLCVVEH